MYSNKILDAGNLGSFSLNYMYFRIHDSTKLKSLGVRVDI
jgi:hypothetical protein